jgi:hypothetical protein
VYRIADATDDVVWQGLVKLKDQILETALLSGLDKERIRLSCEKIRYFVRRF